MPQTPTHWLITRQLARSAFPGDRAAQSAAQLGAVHDAIELARHALRLTPPDDGGYDERVLALARCLCGKPTVMLLDEPTEGIQPSICDEIVDTLKRLRKSHGIAILLVEQDIDFLRELSDRILVLEKGELIADFPSASLTSQEIAQRYCGLHT